jgi:general secretion pathway protein E
MTLSREEREFLGIGGDTVLYRGEGCEKCTHTGYRGRTGIFEFLVINEEIRRLILRNADSGKIRETARKQGMMTLLEDGAEKVRNGITTLSKVLRVTQAE